ncbi:branched-chain amino acid ABC transporter ATP-binding protein [Agrobacterium salinitolerans]|uniref:ABC transporter ATP-binding protein n=1 Tax=Agrobacterium salinitolerans TaxID=1183413 RepID=UPI00098ED235|nr:ABC transporter ATP-binding protein [Agrobacterium salinitolerans]OOO27731.1 branched-chain amino acid ABC transporter ATP-binding protein [Agrobacterium salinitolerans]PNQ25634.1 ABC transporter ATP-binding protein [Rhizobium sp. YIC5082]
MSAGLVIAGLCKNFGGLQVARDLTLTLPQGSRAALIGPNGAGKTTFANLLTGVLKPTSGRIMLNGEDIASLNEAARVKAGIAKTFQITNLFRDLSVRENLRLPMLEREGCTHHIFRRADGWLTIEAEIDRLLQDLDIQSLADKEVRDLAYGQQRLVELALTLAVKPKVLILDEPAAGVPSTESHLIVEAIKRLPPDLSVLIIEHDMQLVFEVADRIIVLVNGAILMEGKPGEVVTDDRVRQLYLGAGHV